MTAKEKAQDLWLKYYELLPDGVYSNKAAKIEAKILALIAAIEITDALKQYGDENFETQNMDRTLFWWDLVKAEIKKI